MEQEIFRNGSTTYYWTAKFFPEAIRRDVFDLYSFVRVADDYVDQVPADEHNFHELRGLWDASQDTVVPKQPDDTVNERVVKNMRRLHHEYNFDDSWPEAFLDAMQADLDAKRYETLDDSLHYVYGSAEVVGLMLSRIMDLNPEAQHAARMQGRAMQWVNFIRDIQEDNDFDRIYFPQDELKKYNLADLSAKTASTQPQDFQNFIQVQTERAKNWQSEAEMGYKYIPRRLRIPIKTAAGMYSWTAGQIAEDPLVIFERKVKPSKQRILANILKNTTR